MSNAAVAEAPRPAGEVKDLYEIGEIPPLGHVPKNMYSWAIRQERHGPPDEAMQIEVLPTWELDSHDILILVMAAGVNLFRMNLTKRIDWVNQITAVSVTVIKITAIPR